MKTLFTDIRKNIIAPKFIFGVVLILLLCLLSDAPTVSARNPMSVFDEIVRMRRSLWIDNGSNFCNLNIIYNFNNSTWYPIILPVVSSFPAVYSFYDEWFSDNYFMTLPRYGYKKYAFSKTISSFISGVCVFLGGLLLFSLVVTIVFPHQNEYENVNFYYLQSYKTFGGIITAKIINNCVLCGLYSVISMIICLIVKEKFFTLSFIMVIQYFSWQIHVKFSHYFFEHNLDMLKYDIFFPDQHDNLYNLMPNYNISFWWYICYAFVVVVLIMLCIYFIIRRRYRNAS